jgi:hypothetical protein
LQVEPTLAAALTAGALAAAPPLAAAGVDESPPPHDASTAQSDTDTALRPRQEKGNLDVMAQG